MTHKSSIVLHCIVLLVSGELFVRACIQCELFSVGAFQDHVPFQNAKQMRSLLVLEESFLQLHVALFHNHVNDAIVTNHGIVCNVTTDSTLSIHHGHVNVINGQDTRNLSVKHEQEKW